MNVLLRTDSQHAFVFFCGLLLLLLLLLFIADPFSCLSGFASWLLTVLLLTSRYVYHSSVDAFLIRFYYDVSILLTTDVKPSKKTRIKSAKKKIRERERLHQTFYIRSCLSKYSIDSGIKCLVDTQPKPFAHTSWCKQWWITVMQTIFHNSSLSGKVYGVNSACILRTDIFSFCVENAVCQ